MAGEDTASCDAAGVLCSGGRVGRQIDRRPDRQKDTRAQNNYHWWMKIGSTACPTIPSQLCTGGDAQCGWVGGGFCSAVKGESQEETMEGRLCSGRKCSVVQDKLFSVVDKGEHP